MSLRRAVDADALCRSECRDDVYILGSFWPHSVKSFESRVVKGFKACCPVYEYEPHVLHLAQFYCRQILARLGNQRFEWVVRVLGSSETDSEHVRPMALIVDQLCFALNSRDCTHLFFKTEPRPPMRSVDRLCGVDVQKNRIRYLIQDLFVRPAELGDSVLLVDDIANTGASTKVYAYALKAFAGARRVVVVNLAVTRLAGGKDGYGILSLDTCGIDVHPYLRRVFLDEQNIFHLSETCVELARIASLEMRFLAERKAGP
ncbi:MAG: hypothetical protein ACUVRS_09260 [Armatimonadota bacterium]